MAVAIVGAPLLPTSLRGDVEAFWTGYVAMLAATALMLDMEAQLAGGSLDVMLGLYNR